MTFLKKQLDSAQSKPLGRTECVYRYDMNTGKTTYGERRVSAATQPPNVTAGMFPVGRSRGVAKPGSEANGEREVQANTPPTPLLTGRRKRG